MAADLFYSRLFTLDPSMRAMFPADLAEQKKKLMAMLKLAVNSLNRLDELVPAVQALGQRHGTYGVTFEQYETVGAALLWTLEQGLGEKFTPDVQRGVGSGVHAAGEYDEAGGGSSGGVRAYASELPR